MVVEVAEGSWAALGGMRGGDLIISINQQSIADVAALEKTLKQLAQGKPRQVVLGVQRGIHSLYLELEPDWNQKESTPKGAKS
jgi:C-terminal processing protease CtpA/Prc